MKKLNYEGLLVKLFYGTLFTVIISMFVILLCSLKVGAQPASVEIGDLLIITDVLDRSAPVEHVADGTDIPQGYFLITRGKFKTGMATIKCGERLMIQKTEEKARKIGANAFRFYELKEPDNVFNTCYSSKIMFFLRK